MIKLLAEASFGIFAATNLLASVLAEASVGGGVYEWVNRFGALGLCAFMVFQNYRQSERLGRVIAKKDEVIEARNTELMKLTKSLATAIDRNTNAMSGMSKTLRERPCMAGQA
jgi:hypothetical protein